LDATPKSRSGFRERGRWLGTGVLRRWEKGLGREREREGREGLRLAAREGREGGTRVGSGRKVREAGMESVRDQDS